MTNCVRAPRFDSISELVRGNVEIHAANANNFKFDGEYFDLSIYRDDDMGGRWGGNDRYRSQLMIKDSCKRGVVNKSGFTLLPVDFVPGEDTRVSLFEYHSGKGAPSGSAGPVNIKVMGNRLYLSILSDSSTGNNQFSKVIDLRAETAVSLEYYPATRKEDNPFTKLFMGGQLVFTSTDINDYVNSDNPYIKAGPYISNDRWGGLDSARFKFKNIWYRTGN